LGGKEKAREILNNWQGARHLKMDSWENVKYVLDSYGFIYEKKSHWVCTHPVLSSLAKLPRSKDLLTSAKLGVSGEFSVAVTHGKGKDSGKVFHVYLKIIANAIQLVGIVSSSDGQRKEGEENGE
jgi:hypothetical protein